MLAPSKILSINDSSLYKAAKLGSMIDRDTDLIDLFERAKRDFRSLSDFIDALDLLFILGKIDLDHENGAIKIA
jgi:hypothetical protein